MNQKAKTILQSVFIACMMILCALYFWLVHQTCGGPMFLAACLVGVLGLFSKIVLIIGEGK